MQRLLSLSLGFFFFCCRFRSACVRVHHFHCSSAFLLWWIVSLALWHSRSRVYRSPGHALEWLFSAVCLCVCLWFFRHHYKIWLIFSHHAPPPLTTNGLSNIPVSFDTRVFVSLSTRGKSAPTGGRDGKIPPAYCVRVRHLVTRLNTSKNDKLRRYTVNLFRRSIFEFQSKI